MSDPRPGHARVSDTPTAKFPWGAIKGPSCLSSTVGHSFHLSNTLRHSLELPTSLLQASFKSKLPRRDLTSLLSDPLNLHLKHFTDGLRAFVTLRDLFP
jgi:hypothetical protein